MDEHRPCTIKCEETKWKDGVGQQVIIYKKAFFHRFADDWTYADDLKIPFTSAIVEFEDGQLKKVDPALIKFIEPALKTE
jgi:hypothetical protein